MNENYAQHDYDGLSDGLYADNNDQHNNDNNDVVAGGADTADGMKKVDFWTACSANGIMVDLPELERLERYHNELRYWNAKVNLISRKDEQNIWERHILHSLALLKYVRFPDRARVLDVGTGGGLPGIPLKCVRTDLKMTLADSIAKKVKATSMFAQHTQLKDVRAITARVEELADDPHYRKAFDVIVSRAVARVSALMTWVTPLMKPGGYCVFLKGGDLTEELNDARADHPGLQIEVIDIDLFGVPSFKADAKKIVRCWYA